MKLLRITGNGIAGTGDLHQLWSIMAFKLAGRISAEAGMETDRSDGQGENAEPSIRAMQRFGSNVTLVREAHDLKRR
jgi:hypothetical protein